MNSCFTKVFSSILNSRLNKYSDSINLISKAQAGFRRGFSTIDNIFVLFALISIYFSFGKKLYCTFIDFKSAFDTVWRAGLWQKLQKSGVKGKVFTVILNMYQNVKSYVKLGHDCSEYFSCDIGVKQGENLSPFLFSIFLNDLETFFVDKNINCLDNISQLCHDSLLVYIKLFIILYADDTALLSESAEGLQSMLNSFEEYCTNWKLKVNTNKTKVVIFGKRKEKGNLNFRLCNQSIEILDSYSYSGVVFNYNGSFCTAKKKLLEQAQKSLYALYTKIKNINIPIDLQLKLFDALVAPILLYSSEVWGFENKDNIEKMHLQFCKKILKIRNSTPNFMVYGELGRFPLEIIIKQKMILFWNSLLIEDSKLSSILYQLMFKLYDINPSKFKWIKYIKSILDDCGLSYMWTNQLPIDRNSLKSIVKQQLVDQFIQNWFSQISNSSRGDFYSIFKSEFNIEPYLMRLNEGERIPITKLRCANIKFPIETGRWSGISRENRFCNLCRNFIGDEFHYLFKCENHQIQELRIKYLPEYYVRNPNINKLKGMLSLCHVELYKKLSIFFRKLIKLL